MNKMPNSEQSYERNKQIALWLQDTHYLFPNHHTELRANWFPARLLKVMPVLATQNPVFKHPLSGGVLTPRSDKHPYLETC